MDEKDGPFVSGGVPTSSEQVTNGEEASRLPGCCLLIPFILVAALFRLLGFGDYGGRVCGE